LNNLLQNFTWITGVLYVLMLIGSVGFAYASRVRPSNWLIGFYILLVILLIMGSILMSNIYEDFLNDSGDFSDRLREHTTLSFMILYSPTIFAVIGILTGIILFSGRQEEEFV